MKEHFINLTDGTRLEIKINFGTLYYLKKCNAISMMKKISKKNVVSDDEAIEAAAKIIYAIIRSNGRAATFDEAIQLVPMGTTEIQNLVEAFQENLEDYKKKEDAKANMRKRR